MKQLKFNVMQNFYRFGTGLMIVMFYVVPQVQASAQQFASNFDSNGISRMAETDQTRTIALTSVIEAIETKYYVRFNFNSRLIENKVVRYQRDLNLQGDLDEVLDKILIPLDLYYEKVGKDQYVIYSKEEKEERSRIEKIRPEIPKIRKSEYPVVKSYRNYLLDRWAANEQSVSGKVTDVTTGEALPGVNVLVKGTSLGTATDADGKYHLNLSDEITTLIFSSIGYETLEQDINGRAIINVGLSPDITSLSEVVVVGYGTVKKSDLTGSVVSLKSEDINQGINTSVDQLLKGRAAGVNVVQNSSEPGGGISVSIRGASSFTAGNEPLYVIDGLAINNSALTTNSGATFPTTRTPSNPLNAINPNDIESIEVLKDASATAIYGARGANGVILITTKKGEKGKMRINYDGYAGVQNVIGKQDVLNPEEYKKVLNELIEDGGGIAEQTVEEIQDGGTDWQELLFKKNAAVQNHNLSFSGGNDNTTYYGAVNYFNQQGVVVSSSFQRYGARLNVTTRPNDKLEIGLNLNTSYSKNDLVPAQSFGVNEDNGALYAAYNFDPTLAPRDASGNYQISPFISIDNPLALAYGKNAVTDSYRVLGIAFANYKILPSLSVKLNVGTDVTNQRKDVYVDRTTKDGRANGGIGSIFEDTRSNYLVEATATYDVHTDLHDITLLGGITTQRFFSKSADLTSRNFPADATGTDNLGLGDPTLFSLGSGRGGYQLLSYIGRINYTFNSKYLFTATMRIDGSSRFGTNNKYGYFPSAAFAWKLKEESFLKGADFLSTMKLRTSWGRTGNQEIGNYQSISTFTPGPTAVINDQQTSTTNPSRLANPDLKWETTEQWDIGLDFGFLTDRIAGSVDYFRKNTFDMLINLPVPTSTGFPSQLQNVGSIVNHGFELTLNTVNLDGPFRWTSALNLATVKNSVKSLGGIDQIIGGGAGFASQIFLTEKGETLRSFYGYQIDGIWQTGDDFNATKDNVSPGDLKYRDINGDSIVNADDRVILGNSFPKLTWSFGNTFEYKNFSLMVFFEGVQGVSMLNNNLVDTYFPINFRRNKSAEPYLNRWTEENPSDKYPSFINPTAQGSKEVNSYTVEDASYIRLKTITLNYQFPRLGKVLTDVTVYITASNLWTITDYSGIDPAVNPNGSALTRIDYNAYPTAKSVLLGIKIGF